MRHENPETKENIRRLVIKVLIKFAKNRMPYVKNMQNWLQANNLGDVRDDMNLRAVIDVMFRCTSGKMGPGGGDWYPIDNGKNADQLTEEAYRYWTKRFAKKSL